MRERHKKINMLAEVIILSFLIIFFSKAGISWAAEEEIPIGVIFSMTGSGAQWGERMSAGAKLATEEENAAGGIHGKKLKLLVCDNETQVRQGVACANKLISVNHIPISLAQISGVVVALLPIFNENKTVLLNPGAYHPAIRKAGPYVFSVMHLADDDCMVQVDFIRKTLKLKRGAIVYINNGFGVVMAKTIKEEWEKLGGEVLAFETHQQDATDFRTILAKIKALKPDVVFLESHYKEMGLMVKQAQEVGITGVRWISYAGLHTPQFTEIAGSAAEGVFCTVSGWDPSDTREIARKFAKNLKEKYGYDPEIYGAMCYDAIKIVADVMRKYGTTAEDIKKGLSQVHNFLGVTGSVSFDKDGVAVRKIWISEYKNGQWIPYKGYEYLKKIE